MAKLQNSVGKFTQPTFKMSGLSFSGDVFGYDLLNLSQTTTDIHTVSSGKRAYIGAAIFSNYNGAGNVLYNFAIKISGTSYRVTAATNLANGSSVVPSLPDIILEAGETFQIVTATNNGLGAWFKIIEFDANIPTYSSRVLSPASGDNTIYTCPANTKAVTVSGFAPYLWDQQASSTIKFANNTAGALTAKWYVVPSGGAAGTTNKVIADSSVTNATTGSVQANMIMAAGDFVVVNLSGDAANSPIWVTVSEKS